LQGPGGAAVGRLGAGQGDQPGLGPAVELTFAAGAVLLLAAQGCVQAALDEALADALDGAEAAIQGFGDAVVGPGGAARGLGRPAEGPGGGPRHGPGPV